MEKTELIDVSSKDANVYHCKIKDIAKCEEFLLITLDNEQKILTSGNSNYDISNYDTVLNIFKMKDKLCALVTKNQTKYVINLKTMEILFEDKNAYYVSKQDEITLHVIMQGNESDKIFNIETKKYLPAPSNYEFENKIGINLYVFREPFNINTPFYDKKRCLITAEGEIVLSNIKGWIEIVNNTLIINRKNELYLANIDNNKNINVNSLKKFADIIAKPIYSNEKIVIIKKGTIQIYSTDLKLIKEISNHEIDEITDCEIISNVLKLCLSSKSNNQILNKHLFINLESGKSISHLRIEGYPYWNPTTYVGKNSLSDETNYYFYDKNFNFIKEVFARSFECLDENGTIFALEKPQSKQKSLLNTKTRKLINTDYDYIAFPYFTSYGYGVNINAKKIDFFDHNLNIMFAGFNYEKFNINFIKTEFSYFIINKFLCVHNHFIDDYGRSCYQTIIQKDNGEIITNSINCTAEKMGIYIKIKNGDKISFFNTITEKEEILALSYSSAKDSKINMINEIKMEKLFANSIDNSLMQSKNPEKELYQKVKLKKQ